MQPPETLALLIVAAGAGYLAVGALLDLVRRLARVRLGWLPSLQRTTAAVGLVITVARSTPAGAALPPPTMRLEPQPVPVAATVEEFSAPEPPPVSAMDTYRVQPGDSLWAIAARALGDAEPADVDRYWRAIYEENRALVGEDPNLIFPGQILAMPSP